MKSTLEGLKVVVVELKVVSKKQKLSYSSGSQISHEIELEVPYDQNNIFWKLSGGTNMVLNTINQEASNMFILGETVVMTISPKEKEELVNK